MTDHITERNPEHAGGRARTAAHSPPPVIEVRGLRKSYRGKPALAGVDLEIRGGEVFALLGPNGAGKTTTIEILCGLRPRDEGVVSVLGADPAQAGRSWRARIGIVPQGQGQAGELTVQETVAHYAAYFPGPAEVAEVIESVGLAAQAGTRLRRLSGGQRRRVDVAIGLVGRPELLFLDEPTTGFDPQARRAFWDLIAGLAGDGTTIVLTTHYLDEAAALAARVGVLAAGRVAAVGTPAELAAAGSAAIVTWQDPQGPRSTHTITPTECVLQLARQAGGEIPGLSVKRPSLEDRYLELISATEERATEERATEERATAEGAPR